MISQDIHVKGLAAYRSQSFSRAAISRHLSDYPGGAHDMTILLPMRKTSSKRSLLLLQGAVSRRPLLHVRFSIR